MIDKLRVHMNDLFARYPNTRANCELKDELLGNLTERYNDLVGSGMPEGEAYAKIVSSVGDIDELVQRASQTGDPAELAAWRKKSALLTVVGLMFIFIGVIAMMLISPIISEDSNIDSVVMLASCAVGVCFLVYNSIANPKPRPAGGETVLEDYRVWKSDSRKRKSMLGALSSLLWTGTLAVYFIVSFTSERWDITWILFIVAAFLQTALRMLFVLANRD